MAYPSENVFVVHSKEFDIGNTGANVAAVLIPVKCAVVSVACLSTTAVANSFTVSCDSLTAKGVTQGAEDVAKIIVPDSTAAFAALYDLAGRGVVLNAGDSILVQVDEAGDSGEKALVAVALQYLPETEANAGTTNITLTA